MVLVCPFDNEIVSKSGLVVYVCNPNTQEEVLGQKFKASLSYEFEACVDYIKFCIGRESLG